MDGFLGFLDARSTRHGRAVTHCMLNLNNTRITSSNMAAVTN